MWILEYPEGLTCFESRNHIIESISLSYHKCQSVHLSETYESAAEPDGPRWLYIVTGIRDGQQFIEHLSATQHPIWNEPVHL